MNLKESLLRMDRKTDFKYELVDLYESCRNLTEDDKKKLAQYVDGYDVKRANELLTNRAGVPTDAGPDDVDVSPTVEGLDDYAEKERRILKLEDIEYIMSYEYPIGCKVRDGVRQGEYEVSDDSGKVSVKVKFDLADPSAHYVFYIDGEGPEATNSSEWVTSTIGRAVDRKLNDWIGNSDRRRNKAVNEASVNRVITHHTNGVPMAFISPDRLDKESDPEVIKANRVQFKKDLDDKVRTVGFGYNKVRGGYVNKDGGEAVPVDGEVSYIIYGKPDKKSEQLLKEIAVELGKKYGQETVGFSDLNGKIYYIHTAYANDGTHYSDTDTPYVRWDDNGDEVQYGDSDIEANAWGDIKKGMNDYYTSFTRSGKPDHNTNRAGRTFYFEELYVSRGFEPIEKFNSTSQRLRRRNNFVAYCNECWDEASQTFKFDQKFHSYF